MPKLHAGYGLILEADAPLSGFVEASVRDGPDIRFWLESRPAWAASAYALPRRSHPWGRTMARDSRLGRHAHELGDGAFFHIAYADRTEFVVSGDGRSVYGAWIPPLTLADTLTYALGPITAICLRRLGRVCVHGSAVGHGDGAVLFVGDPGAGKSTTAAGMIGRGAAALTDDVAVIDLIGETPTVHPGHLWYRLWPDSARLLYGSETSLPRLTPNWDKQYLDATRQGCSRAPRPVPILGVYFLGGGAGATEPLIARLSPRDSLVRLLSNTLGGAFVDAPGRAHEFHVLSRLAQSAPCSMIGDHRWDLPIDALLDLIEHDLACPAST